MHTNFRRIFIGLAVLSFAVTYLSGEENLVENGGFENVRADGEVVGWGKGYTWTGEYETTSDSMVYHEGKRSVRISNAGNPGRSAWVSRNPFAVEEKKGYRLTLHVRAQDATSLKVNCHCYGCDKSFMFDLDAGTYDWKKYTFSFVTPEKTDSIRIYLYNMGKGTVWFDAVEFIKEPLSEEAKQKVLTVNGTDFYYVPRKNQPDPPLPPLSPVDKERGFVVFIRHDPRDVYPDSRPLKEEITTTMRAFGTPGQFVSAWFSVYALRNINEARVDTPASLRNETGDVISGSNIYAKIIQCWPQRTTWSGLTYYIIPELLEDMKNIEIPVATSQSFWIQAKIPEDAKSGIYTAPFLFQYDGHTTTINLQLRVLPFTLEVPEDKFWGLYADAPRWDKMSDEEMKRDLRDMKEYGMTRLIIETGKSWFEKKDGKITEFKCPLLERFQKTRTDMGFNGPILLATYAIPSLTVDSGEDRKREFQDALLAIDIFMKKTGKGENSEWYYEGVHEANDEERVKLALVQYKLAKEVGMKTLSHTYLDWAIRTLGPYLDVVCTAMGAETEEINNARRKLLKEFGCKYWFIGGGCYSGQEGGLMPNRYLAGFLFYKTKAESHWSWTYQRPLSQKGDPYNDFDGDKTYKGEMKEYAITYPAREKSSDKVSIFTLQWEGIREGRDDYLYIYTLNQWIDRAKRSDDKKIISMGEQAEKKLEEILARVPWTAEFTYEKFDNYRATKYRWAIANEIMKLKNALLEMEKK